MTYDTSKLIDIQSEAGIIASLFFHPDFLLYSEHLRPDYFIDKTNAGFYWAISELYKANITNIDVYNISNILNSDQNIKKQIESELPTHKLGEFIELSKNVARHTVEEYSQLVKQVTDFAYRRELLKNLQKCESYCLSTGLNRQDLQKNIYETIDKASTEFISYDEIPEYAEQVDKLWEQTVQRQKDGLFGLPSKFKTLNEFCTYEQGELITVTAYRKDGKSMFCMNELVDKLKMDISCLYIDTEMSDRLFNERLLSHLTKIPLKLLKSGKYNEESANQVEKAKEWLKTKTFTHLYLPGWTNEQVYITAKKLKRKNNMQFLIMDYFKSNIATDASSAYNELGNAVNFVKNEICGELDISGLAAAQLNRGGEIGDSYKVEQYSSVVLTIKRKKQKDIDKDGEECGNYKLFVKLNRLGDQMGDIETDYIDLLFRGDVATFSEAKKQHDLNPTPFDD